MNEPSPPEPPSSDDIAIALQELISASVQRRLSEGMPRLLTFLGPALVASRASPHKLLPLFDSVVNAFTQAERELARDMLLHYSNEYAKAAEEAGVDLTPLVDPDQSVVQLFAHIRAVAGSAKFTPPSQSPSPHE